MGILDIFNKKLNNSILEYVKEQKEYLKTINSYTKNNINDISGKSVSGGIPNTHYNAGDIGDAFSFPSKFAITAKQMDNTSICSSILNAFRSLITEFDWKFTYEDKDLINDKLHKEVLDFIENQFNELGGVKFFISKFIRDFLKYGIILINPILDFKYVTFNNKKRYVPTIKDVRSLDPQGILNLYASVENNNEINAVNYLSMAKSTYDPITGNISNGVSSTVLIDFDKSLSCICTLDTIEDPMGRSFLKDIWSMWRILLNFESSINSNLISVGEHSWYFVPNQLFFDNHENAVTQVYEAISNFMNTGGVFVCSYGHLEKFDSMDLSKYQAYLDQLGAQIYSHKGMNINNMGNSYVSSYNVAQFAQADALIRASEIATQFAYQFSSNFIRKYIEKTFVEYFISKKLKATPILTYEVINSETTDIMKNLDQEKTKDSTDIELTAVSSNSISTVMQNKNKTWIKNKLNNNEEFVINTQQLDDVLIKAEDQLANFFVKQMKMDILNQNKLKEAVDNPNSIVNKKTLTRDQEENFNNELNTILYGVIYSFFLEEANRYEKSLNIQNKDFFTEFKLSKEAFASRETQKLLRKKEIKDFKRNQLASFINEIDNTLMNEIRRVSNIIENNKELGLIELTENIENIKGINFEKLAPLAVISIFATVNNKFNDINKNDGMTLVRSGILENQCDHCSQYMGAEYQWDGFGYSGVMDYRSLPDAGCYGGSRCRCFYIRLPLKEISNIREAMNEGI